MAKKFMFVCVGLLALTVAFLLGAQFGRAEYVDHTTTGLIAACAEGPGGFFALGENGGLYEFMGRDRQWYDYGQSLPVPASEVKFFVSYNCFISVRNEAWYRDGLAEPWLNLGGPPGLTSTQSATWGSIKAQFNK